MDLPRALAMFDAFYATGIHRDLGIMGALILILTHLWFDHREKKT